MCIYVRVQSLYIITRYNWDAPHTVMPYKTHVLYSTEIVHKYKVSPASYDEYAYE